jgi:hypothetical protein
MESPSHYELLCLTPEATADEIRAAYRRLIRVYHPDVASASGEAMTRRLNDAQRVLLDPALRGAYDRVHGGVRPAPARPAAQPTTRPTTRTNSRAWDPPKPADRAPSEPWSRGRFAAWLAWGFVAFSSITVIVVASLYVFIACYTGGALTIASPRMLPPVVIAVAWLVIGIRRRSPLLITVLLAGGALWPLAKLGVEPFGMLQASVPAAVLPLLTATAIAAITLRVAGRRFNDRLRDRPVHRPQHA